MIFKGICLPYRPRFALFLIGIAFLGAISGPLQAADNPSPSTWDKLFGSAPKTPESDPKEQKPKKTKASKESTKKQKSPSPQKASAESPIATPSGQGLNQTAVDQETRPSDKTETAPKVANPSSSSPFWKDLFRDASSSSPFLEGATQSSGAQPISEPVKSPSVDTAITPPPPPTTSLNEPGGAEPFWKKIFSGASSKQPEFKLEQTAPAEPVKEATSLPAATSNKSGGDEEPSFWQKLFGGKSTDTKVGASKTKTFETPIEKSTSTPAPPPAPLSLPTVVAPSQSTTETKANFALATVCEREKCELMILYDAPINKTNVDKFIQSTASIPAGTAVLFNSIDGDLNSGIKLGQALRQKRFNARVGRTKLNKKTLNEIDGQCFSACVLAFAGGVNRQIDPNDQIGIYALRSNSKTVNENELKTAVNNLGMYFEQMGVDRRFVNQMLQIKGSTVSLVSLSNAKLLNLDNGTRIVTYPWRMQALDDGLLIILVTEKQAANHFSITLGLTKQSKDKDFRLTIYAKPLSEIPNLGQIADYLNRDTRLQLVFSNQTISPNLMKPWEATSNGVQTAILLSDNELMSMSSALEFELNLLQTSSNPYKLDGVTIFGTSGLKGALAAIKK
jgi:hypothetical protein